MLEEFNLKTYLAKEYILKTLDGNQINNLPEIDLILNKINSFLESHRFSSSLTGHGQLYDCKFTFDRDNYCTLTWDIDRVKLICDEYELPIGNLKVNLLAKTIYSDAIDLKFLEQGLHNNEPVIVASLPMVNSYEVIDGNHRVMSRYRNNIEIVRGYYLEPMYHFFAMPNDTSRALFLGLTIVENIKRYLIGTIPKTELIGSLNDIDTFYDMSVEKELINMFDNYKQQKNM